MSKLQASQRQRGQPIAWFVLFVDKLARRRLRMLHAAQTACGVSRGHHLNPVRAHLLRPEERLLAYPWSSLGYYLAAPEHRPQWIRVDRLLREHGIRKDTAGGREQFERRMEARRLE